jgi:hypothetical protein
MSTETSIPARRRWYFGWWLLGFALASSAWAGWREYDYRGAVYEAATAGWRLGGPEPSDRIREDLNAAWWIKIWTRRYRWLYLPARTDLASARALIVRLQPTTLVTAQCPNADLQAFRNLSALKALQLIDCAALQNVDGLKGLSALQSLYLGNCPALQNVDALKGLSTLESLSLYGCDAIPPAALRELRAALPKTDIIFPGGSKAPPP